MSSIPVVICETSKICQRFPTSRIPQVRKIEGSINQCVYLRKIRALIETIERPLKMKIVATLMILHIRLCWDVSERSATVEIPPRKIMSKKLQCSIRDILSKNQASNKNSCSSLNLPNHCIKSN